MPSFHLKMIKKKFPTGRVYSKQIRVTANQHNFKFGLNYILCDYQKQP